MANKMRDSLVELIKEAHTKWSYSIGDFESVCADHLIENGVIVPPCKVGQTVYVISDCSRIIMLYDNDYFTGTGAITCPYEDACKFTECNDENTQVIETCVSHMLCDDEGWTFGCENINCCYSFNDIGKTVFLTKSEAEQKLKEMRGE